MSYKYFKRPWDELRGDEYDSWGTSVWYFEVGEDDYVTRQITVYQNGQICKYDEAFIEDEHGGLSEKPLDIEDFVDYKISKDEFELLWG